MSIPCASAAFARGLLLALAVSPAALADVHVVDASGGGDFTTLQAAVDSAADGDTLLVRAGSYAGFVLTGKGLSIVAERGAEPQVAADVRLLNIPAGHTVVLSGLRVTATYTTDPTKIHALVVFGVGAAVRVQDCILIGADNAPNGSSPKFTDGTGGSGVVLSSASDVVLTRCAVVGGRGHQHYNCCEEGGMGGEGLHSISSVAALYDCQITGGPGGYSGWGGHGGPGVWVPDFGLFASGCTFTGGKGGYGDDYIYGPGGNGGSGLKVGATAQTQLRDNLLVGGAGGDSFLNQKGLPGPGLEALAGSVVIQFPGSARRFTVQNTGWEGSLVPVTVEGEPGDRVWFPSSPKTGFRLASALSGVWAIGFPVHMPLAPFGVVPASGTLELLVPLTDLSGEGDLRHFQGYAVSASGKGFTGTPTSFVRLGCAFSGDCDNSGVPDACEIQAGAVSDCNHNGIPDACDVSAGTLPDCNANGTADVCDIQGGSSFDCDQDGIPDECQFDCNGNGVADICDVQSGASQDCDGDLVPDECNADCNANGVPDACDIAQGTSLDANGNGVPDECQSPTNVYLVDDDGPPYGADGSPAKPFDTLGKAFAYAIDGNTILVADGTYRGAENRGLAFAGRDLTVVSQGGAAAVVIDCEGQDRAFVLDAGTSLAARLEGLTIRNGNSEDAQLLPGLGGGVVITLGGAGTLVDCVIEECRAVHGGGMHVNSQSHAWIEGCTLRRNTAPFALANVGGAGISSFGLPSTGSLVIVGCTLRENLSGSGSAIFTYSGTTVVDSCDVSFNEYAGFGEASAIWHAGSGSLQVLRSTITQNEGGVLGAGIYSQSTGSLLVSHCILDGNASNFWGAAISVRNFGQLKLTTVVDNCRITGHSAGSGAGLSAINVPWIQVRNCTIAQGSAIQGGAAYLENVPWAVFRNCVVWGNTASLAGASFHASNSTVDVDACDVQGGLAGTFAQNGATFLWGAANLDANPLFVDPDGPDNSPATWADNDFRLGPFSPCADAGDNAAVSADVLDLDGDLNVLEPVPFDLDLLPRFEDDPAVPDTGLGTAPIVDLGAFERP